MKRTALGRTSLTRVQLEEAPAARAVEFRRRTRLALAFVVVHKPAEAAKILRELADDIESKVESVDPLDK